MQGIHVVTLSRRTGFGDSVMWLSPLTSPQLYYFQTLCYSNVALYQRLSVQNIFSSFQTRECSMLAYLHMAVCTCAGSWWPEEGSRDPVLAFFTYSFEKTDLSLNAALGWHPESLSGPPASASHSFSGGCWHPSSGPCMWAESTLAL